MIVAHFHFMIEDVADEAHQRGLQSAAIATKIDDQGFVLSGSIHNVVYFGFG